MRNKTNLGVKTTRLSAIIQRQSNQDEAKKVRDLKISAVRKITLKAKVNEELEMTPTECGLSKNDRKGLRKRPFADGADDEKRGANAREKTKGAKNEEPEKKKAKRTQKKENLIVYPWMLETRSSNKCKDALQILIFFF